jgi:hypothetical protein
MPAAIKGDQISKSPPEPKRENFHSDGDFLNALMDAAPVSPFPINADKFGYTEGDITVTCVPWSEDDWRRLAALAPQIGSAAGPGQLARRRQT